MPVYYELLLDEPFDASRPAVESKRAMARALAARFHGSEAAAEAEAHFDRLHVAREAPAEIEEFAFAGNGGDVHLPALLREAFGVSGSEARRLLAQGGVRLDGAPLASDQMDIPADRLEGAVLQLGKRRFRRITLA